MPLGERIEPLGHGYKELEIPALPDFPAATMPAAAAAALARGERFAIEPNALHIWPRGSYMCIALPNAEGSFTVTLFLPNEGDPSFATVDSPAAARALFERDFADALPLIPDLEKDFAANPVGLLATLYLDRWHLDRRALLIGDAAHAIVPFHGQGMNCGFEDAVELADLIAARADDPAAVFAEFERRRRPNAEAIATMALENYVEMRDSVADPAFLLRRALGRVLADRNPDHFVPRYALVTFTRMPYAEAFARGAAQDRLLRELAAGKDRLDDIDLAGADVRVRRLLAPFAP
jgi:kynurenine 3-monooxygenase